MRKIREISPALETLAFHELETGARKLHADCAQAMQAREPGAVLEAALLGPDTDRQPHARGSGAVLRLDHGGKVAVAWPGGCYAVGDVLRVAGGARLACVTRIAVAPTRRVTHRAELRVARGVVLCPRARARGRPHRAGRARPTVQIDLSPKGELKWQLMCPHAGCRPAPLRVRIDPDERRALAQCIRSARAVSSGESTAQPAISEEEQELGEDLPPHGPGQPPPSPTKRRFAAPGVRAGWFPNERIEMRDLTGALQPILERELAPGGRAAPAIAGSM